jgi:hypothetical protein
MLKALILSIVTILFSFGYLGAVPMYDEGSMLIKGVQLLRDKDDKNAYYYIPQYPRLSTKADKSYELLCMKYTGKNKESNGGVFHALIEFNLPDNFLKEIEVELKKKNSEGHIVGPVPMMENTPKEGEEVEPTFRIVSAILSSTEGANAMTSKVITSGKAPITPGSKAAISALLNQQGVTLLWNSLQSNTSDVSIALDAYYEAAVKGYNAMVTADMSVFYKHFSIFSNKQGGYKKTQIRNVVDSLARMGGIKIDVVDRSQGLNIKTGDMESILNLVTNKLLDVLFNLEKGWAVSPNKVDRIEGFREVGKVDDGKDKVVSQVGDYVFMGPFAGLMGSKFNEQYIPDDQYVLKDIKDIRTNKFVLNLSKTSTIRVPIHTAGNIGAIYGLLGNDPQYFRIVNMEDATFQRKDVSFFINGKFADGFGEWVNAVSVNFRKKYSNGQEDVTGRVSFLPDDLKKGTQLKSVDYPRLGIATDDWEEYEYQIKWDINGKAILSPTKETEWLKARTPMVTLNFPFDKEEVIIDADKAAFTEKGISAVQVVFASQISGEKKVVRSILIRASDTEFSKKVNIYHDSLQPIVCKITWYSPQGEKTMPLEVLKETNYMTLIPK